MQRQFLDENARMTKPTASALAAASKVTSRRIVPRREANASAHRGAQKRPALRELSNNNLLVPEKVLRSKVRKSARARS